MSRFAENFLKLLPGVWGVTKKLKTKHGIFVKAEGLAKVTQHSKYSVLYQENIKYEINDKKPFTLTPSFIYCLQKDGKIIKKLNKDTVSQHDNFLYKLKFKDYFNAGSDVSDEYFVYQASYNFVSEDALEMMHIMDSSYDNMFFSECVRISGETLEFES